MQEKTTYYTSGEFAGMAHVTVRTIRFYDKQNILKPSFVSANGTRFYTDADFARLQQILLLKYLGFSLDDIRQMTAPDPDPAYLRDTLTMQKKLVQDRIEQMRLVEEAIDATAAMLSAPGAIDWSRMLDLIHLTAMENSLKSQYLNASNISARIRLHSAYSKNPTGWFPWLLSESLRYYHKSREDGTDSLSSSGRSDATPDRKCGLPDGLCILELGCGSGALWTENADILRAMPNARITLTDISEGIIRDLKRSLPNENGMFSFATADCNAIPYPDKSFDIVYANHLLFYCDDIPAVLREVRRVLKDDGLFCCSTYSGDHMKEITELVQTFDARIVLSGEKLYERFGLCNGQEILSGIFPKIKLLRYEDEIILDRSEPLIAYILSCHGNQNRYLLERYREFREFVEQRVHPKLTITKDAGIFLCGK